jgi:hypothetical protein
VLGQPAARSLHLHHGGELRHLASGGARGLREMALGLPLKEVPPLLIRDWSWLHARHTLNLEQNI